MSPPRRRPSRLMQFGIRSLPGWLIAGCICLSTPSYGDHNLLGNSTFDSGVESWTFVTTREAQMTFDPARGEPAPGSLRIRGSDGSSGFVIGEALSECFDGTPGTRYIVTGRTRSEHIESQGKCRIRLTRYLQPECIGERSLPVYGEQPAPDVPGVWASDGEVFELSNVQPSFRVSLGAEVVVGEGEVACNFDSVVLYVEGSLAPIEVPMLSRAGWVALVVALASGAIWSLGRT